MSGFRLRFAAVLALALAPMFAPPAEAYVTQCAGVEGGAAPPVTNYVVNVAPGITWGQHLSISYSSYDTADTYGHTSHFPIVFYDGPPVGSDNSSNGSAYSTNSALATLGAYSASPTFKGTLIPGFHFIHAVRSQYPPQSCITVVSKNDTTTTLAASSNALTFGDTARLTATVTAQTLPTGTVTFSFDNSGTATQAATLKRGPAAGSIAVGDAHTCSVTAAGGLACWGANGSGQLGDGTTTPRGTPTAVSGLTGSVVQIAAGTAHSCALTDDGKVSCWGDDSFGQLGDGGSTASSAPVAVAGLPAGIAAITAGANHNCAATRAGAVWCWGAGTSSQLGDGNAATSGTPVAVTGLSGAATAIAAGGDHTCALVADGTVWCWGANAHGQLGDGTTTSRATATQVAVLGGMTAIAAGTTHTCGLDASGAVWCWGSNGHGELGGADTSDQTTAVNAAGLSGQTAITAGNGHSCSIDATGGAWCWGAGGNGRLGNGDTADQTAPVAMAGLPEQISTFRLETNQGPSYTAGAAAIVAGNGRTYVVTDVGAVRGTGTNADGGLGDGTTTDRSFLTAVTDYVATRVGAVATVAWPQRSPLNYPISVAYGGDAYRSSSASATQYMAVSIAPTTTTLTLSSNEVAIGTSVELTATVSKSVSGSVEFFDGTTSLGTPPFAGGKAKLTVPNFALGSHTLTAIYSGDGFYATSTSSDTTLSVDPIGTMLSLATSSASVTAGSPVTFTATLTPSDVTGGVTFSDGVGHPIGTSTIASGVATFTTSSLSAGSHTIFAQYDGDATHAASGGAVSQTIVKATATLGLTVSTTTPVVGQTLTMVATVTPSTATGIVSFKDGDGKLASVALSGGRASYSISNLGLGSHTLSASYGGDANDTAAASSSIAVTVGAGSTTTTVTADQATVLPGASVGFTATTTAAAPATGTATGSLSFAEGAVTFATKTLSSSSATASRTFTTSGSHPIVATYAGTSSYLGSSGSTTVTVDARIGTPARMNATTAGMQDGAATAVLSNGGRVVVWSSAGQDGSGRGVYGQLYTAAGDKKGSEFRINTTTTGDQTAPSIAALGNGGFVVVWQSKGQDGSGWGIVMRRYAATGAAAGAEAAVNATTTTGDQSAPKVAALGGGGYVVVWQTPVPSTSRTMIRGRLYNNLGVLQGSEFRADTADTTSQATPAVAPTGNGGFVVAWVSSGGAVTANGIRGQRFTDAAVKSGKEFAISTKAATQTLPALAGTADGGFVAAWTSLGQTGSTRSVYAQRFTAAGSRSGSETRINSTTDVDQRDPTVAAFPTGGYLIAWVRQSSTTAATVRWRRYRGTGTASDGEQALSLVGGPWADRPSAVATTDLAFAIAFTAGASPTNTEIWLQRLGLAVAAP